MSGMTTRYALLKHSGHGPLHFDLLLELEPGSPLATWQLPVDPRGAAVEDLEGRRIQDHRPAYLTYEGPVSGGRGHVERPAGGPLEVLSAEADRVEFVLQGPGWAGHFILKRSEDDLWRLQQVSRRPDPAPPAAGR